MGMDHKERLSINLCRIKKEGKVFEIVINPDEALALRDGKEITIPEAVRSDEIFSDANKGLLASDTLLKEIFNTDNKDDMILEILKKGELQLTTDQRKKFTEDKRKQIMNIIQKSAIDPRTSLPIPMTRLENAFDEAKITINEKSADEQLPEILKKLKPVLPIKFEIKRLKITVPATFTGKAYSKVRSLGKFEKEEWTKDGELIVTLSIPSAVESELYDELNAISHGEIVSETIEVYTK